MDRVAAFALRFLSPPLAFLWSLIKGVWGWITADIWHAVTAALLLALGLALWNASALSDQLGTATTTITGLEDARKQDAVNYRIAARDAELRAMRNVTRVEARYQTIIQEKTVEYDQALARNRDAVAGFVRRQQLASTGANPGRASGPALPGNAAVSGGFVPPAGTAIVPIADLDLAAIAFAQRDALIAAWQAASAVNVNDAPPGNARP